MTALSMKQADERQFKQAQSLAEVAASYVIDADDVLEYAAGDLKMMKDLYKKIEDDRLSITRPLDEAKKKTMELFRPHLESVDGAVKTLSGKIASYSAAQQRLRQEQEAKVRAELAKQKAEIEAKAAEAAKENNQDKAAELMIAAAMQPTSVVMPAPTKVKGMSTSELWSAEVFSLLDLVRAVASGAAPLEALQANQTFLNQQAKSFKKEELFPGVKGISKVSVTSR